MARTLETIREDALKLSVEERGALANSLWDSLLTDEEREIEQAWVEEAERRLAGYRAGDRKGVPLDEVMRELREKHSGESRARRRRKA